MLCDGCEEVFLGQGVACGESAFCCEPCFERWFAGGPAERLVQVERWRPSPSATLKLVAVTVVAAGALLASGQDPAQARFSGSTYESPAFAAAATCHKRRVISGQRKRITVPCGRRRVTDPRAFPYPA